MTERSEQGENRTKETGGYVNSTRGCRGPENVTV